MDFHASYKNIHFRLNNKTKKVFIGLFNFKTLMKFGSSVEYVYSLLLLLHLHTLIK